ncbi:MAG: DUF445 family protein [Clostridium sp.]|nr:DUF445 family protein [Clostridium sp.]
MEWLKFLVAPLIGAMIGYCTNYIAVKMLFRPLKPVKIGKVTLPFTPGIIPKRKPALARAIGNMVGQSLIGKEEIKSILSSDTMQNAVVLSISSAIENNLNEKSIKEIVGLVTDEEGYENKKQYAVDYVSKRIVEGVKSIDIAGIIVKEGSAAVKNMGGMLSMFINDSMIGSFAGPIGTKVEEYISTNGVELIKSKVEVEISNIEEKHISELINVDNEGYFRSIIGEMYEKMLDKEIDHIVNAFDICNIVEKKINDMNVIELEQLIMSVMKSELSAIVNLGALIGFVLGLLNLFI